MRSEIGARRSKRDRMKGATRIDSPENKANYHTLPAVPGDVIAEWEEVEVYRCRRRCY